jgi:hypothetical protein
VNFELSKKRKPQLPENVIRVVVMNLMGAGFARQLDGEICVTGVSKRLFELIQSGGS